MKSSEKLKNIDIRVAVSLLGFLVLLLIVMLYKLGSLTKGLSLTEIQTSSYPVGWHGMYASPLFLPLKIIQSIDFKLFIRHGQTLTRLPNVIYGIISIGCFAGLIRMWHGVRTAVLSSLLFACGAWVLHVSRVATYDVMYLFGITSLLLMHQLLYKYDGIAKIWFANLFLWGILLTIPGFVWIVVVDMIFQREVIADSWREFNNLWQRIAAVILPLLFLPLIIPDLFREGQLLEWLGLPNRFPGILTLLKRFAAVFYHLLIRGPVYPDLWLARQPVLDLFVLATCLLGVYFYISKFKSSRSRLLGLMFIISALLVTAGGAVSFTILIPFAYIMSAMGISYLIHNWLIVFPRNPLARGFGVVLVSLAVAMSCIYNLRSYFVAWPHNQTTITTFSRRL